MLSRFFRTPRELWFDILSLLLLLGILTTLSLRIYVTGWTDYLELQTNLLFFAWLIGILLAFFRWDGWSFWLTLIFTSILFVSWRVAAVLLPGSDWTIQFQNLWLRILNVVRQFRSDQIITDPVIFLLLITLSIWLLGLIGSTLLVRKGTVWYLIGVLGTLILVVDRFDLTRVNRSSYYFGFMLFSLVLLTRTFLITEKKLWNARQSPWNANALSILSRLSLILSAVVLSLVWLVPAYAETSNTAIRFWQELTRPYTHMRDKLTNSMASLRGTAASSIYIYADVLPLGNSITLNDDPLFTIKTSVPTEEQLTYYWRTRSFDQYKDGFWQSSTANQAAFDVMRLFNKPADSAARIPIAMEVHLNRDMGQNIISEQYPTAISLPADYFFHLNDDGTIPDVERIRSRELLRRGRTYRVDGGKLVPTIDQLNRSSSDYPKWVVDTYLQLPDDLSPRISTLAASFKIPGDTSYQIASAITDYLRSTITYSSEVNPTPAGKDPIEYFLFESKQGYCNYYATAEVLLLRAAGIPARMVVGYAQGTYDQQKGVYLVQGKDMHAWPEVYFTGLGWVPFEPTAILAPLDYPQTPVQIDVLQQEDLGKEFDRTGSDTGGDTNNIQPSGGSSSRPLIQGKIVQRILVYGSILLLAGVVYYFLRRSKRLHLPLFNLIEGWLIDHNWTVPGWLHRLSVYFRSLPVYQIYLKVDFIFNLLGVKSNPTRTMSENAALWKKELPELSDQIDLLTSQVEKSVYAKDAGDVAIIRHTAKIMVSAVLATAWKRLWVRK